MHITKHWLTEYGSCARLVPLLDDDHVVVLVGRRLRAVADDRAVPASASVSLSRAVPTVHVAAVSVSASASPASAFVSASTLAAIASLPLARGGRGNGH